MNNHYLHLPDAPVASPLSRLGCLMGFYFLTGLALGYILGGCQ